MRLIDADALIKKIDERMESGIYHGASIFLFELFLRMIGNKPTVEAKPVVYGKWIDTQPDYHPGCGNNAHVCSICGDYYTTEQEDLFFCPRCGADMRGGKND